MPTGRQVSNSRERLLRELKVRGACSARALATRLGLTPTAVRLHLKSLARRGMVTAERVRRGVGRPASRWRLAPAAEELFADGHAALFARLGEALGSALGSGQRRRVISALVRSETRRYRRRLPPRGSLWARLRALAAARNEEGFMVRLRRTGGAVELVENHCPICRGAEALPELCSAERRMMCAVLGSVRVVMSEHRLRGDRRCVWRITPRG